MMNGAAEISEDGLYRYRLTRSWAPVYVKQKVCLWVMLNPSTADETEDDPTVRRCVHFSKRLDCNKLTIVNLYAYRTPNPAELNRAYRGGVDVFGPPGWDAVREELERCHEVVAGWGGNAWLYDAQKMAELIRYKRRRALCLGVTIKGHPRHPLYLKNDRAFSEWRGEALRK